MDHLTTLRHQLHAHPELSGSEHDTHDRIVAHLREHAPGIVIAERVGGTGLLAIAAPESYTRTIVYRADTDALPINEESGVPHASTTPGVMHACGHDGHATIAVGLAEHFAKNPLNDTRLIVVFQPAEEIGTGAQAILSDPRFTELIDDPASTRAFAIHNLPGYPMGQLVLRAGPMCPASLGLRLVLRGIGGHSSQPHLSRSPLPPAAELVAQLKQLPERIERAGSLVTITHLSAGIDANFGITPDTAVLCATLRALRSEHLDTLLTKALQLAQRTAEDAALTLEHTIHEQFAAAVNDEDLAARVTDITERENLSFTTLDHPMPWSEDFGYFGDHFPAMLIGIGSGESQPHLHASTYDFPDELIPLAVGKMQQILSSYC
ncbi:MAG: M20 metallopeptidase family protein [Phycisphaerales bacterium]